MNTISTSLPNHFDQTVHHFFNIRCWESEDSLSTDLLKDRNLTKLFLGGLAQAPDQWILDYIEFASRVYREAEKNNQYSYKALNGKITMNFKLFINEELSEKINVKFNRAIGLLNRVLVKDQYVWNPIPNEGLQNTSLASEPTIFVKVEGKEYPFSKLFFLRHSEVARTMFSSQFQEAVSNKCNLQMGMATFKKLQEYEKTKEISKISANKFLQLLDFAYFYQMQPLSEYLENKFVDPLPPLDRYPDFLENLRNKGCINSYLRHLRSYLSLSGLSLHRIFSFQGNETEENQFLHKSKDGISHKFDAFTSSNLFLSNSLNIFIMVLVHDPSANTENAANYLSQLPGLNSSFHVQLYDGKTMMTSSDIQKARKTMGKLEFQDDLEQFVFHEYIAKYRHQGIDDVRVSDFGKCFKSFTTKHPEFKHEFAYTHYLLDSHLETIDILTVQTQNKDLELLSNVLRSITFELKKNEMDPMHQKKIFHAFCQKFNNVAELYQEAILQLLAIPREDKSLSDLDYYAYIIPATAYRLASIKFS